MLLEELGFSQHIEKTKTPGHLEGFETGRIIAEHKERYIVKTESGEFEAEITGNMRFTAKSREDFPAVGDWVALLKYETDFAIIHKIFPRFSVLKRQAVGKFGEIQIIAANIDFAFLVQAVDRDFNINRLQRYLTICNDSKIDPIVVLSKTDLLNPQQVSEMVESIQSRIKNIPVVAISNQTRDGYQSILPFIEKGKTYCLLGSSGAGKSTLVNNLSGKDIMRTGSISISTNRGKHVTSHRELIVLESGGILIDNPGMREVGIVDSTRGLEITFDKIYSFAQNCKFSDCTHTSEIGCSVLEAIKTGQIDRASYENYLKMEKEKAHFETSSAEKKKKEKIFGKMVKSYLEKDIKQKGRFPNR